MSFISLIIAVMRRKNFYFCLPYVLYVTGAGLIGSAVATCNRRPQGASGDRSPVDESFKLLIEGNPSTYIPGQQYNMSLLCANSLNFMSFTLVSESESGASTGYDMLGHFEIIDLAETRFSMTCENMIENTNTNAKTRVDVTWVAPTNPESACVLLKAAVLQHRNVWFIDDGFLTKRFCPEEIDDMNTQTPRVNPCCACDEAKYEILIRRNWSRNTHAKDFPSEAWRTRFSEVVGASHTYNYRFWEYGTQASRGLQELAEHGATATLETEIKANTNSNEIRTIIKAPGVLYRSNVPTSTLAHVRVDPLHHLMSLVTKIVPSPDWILGVAGVELCLLNCTWTEQKVLNLYPWDVGTDSGPSYMSPDQPQIPPDVVRRITSTFPSDYRSPFYDDSGAPMKPLATLYITRKKLYERDCDQDQIGHLECATHPWNEWRECSSKCGAGVQSRVRAYKDPHLAESFNCQVLLSENMNCLGTQCGASGDDIGGAPIAECDLTPWSSWSPCSKRCGRGYSTRTRSYVNVYARERCQSDLAVELEQLRDCDGDQCGGAINMNIEDEHELKFGGFDEPGLLEENMLTNNRFLPNQNQRAPNFKVTDKKSPFGVDFESLDTKGNNRYMDTKEESMYGRQQQPRQHTAHIPATAFINPERADSYHNERLVGSFHGSMQENSNFDNPVETNAKPMDYLNRNSMPLNSRMAKPTSSTFGQERDENHLGYFAPRLSSTQAPFNRLLTVSHTRRPTVTPYDREQDGLREEYDDRGRKAIVVGSLDSSNYDVVQEYCFEKPFASLQSCNKGQAVRNYWFYDSDDRECKIFTADFCDENKNKFRTLEACEGTCHKPQQNLEGTLAMDNSGKNRFETGQLQSYAQRRLYEPGKENRRRTNAGWG